MINSNPETVSREVAFRRRVRCDWGRRRSYHSGAPGRPAGRYELAANSLSAWLIRNPDLAVLVGGVVEEAAQAAINAQAVGGAVEIPGELRAAALQRAMAFETAGTKTA